MKVRPLHDWIVVKLEPDQAPSSIIAAPDTYSQNIRKGVVVEVGPGAELPNGIRDPVEVSPGERVCFLRWHHEHRPGKAQVAALKDLSVELGAEVVMVRRNDILFVYDGEPRIELGHR